MLPIRTPQEKEAELCCTCQEAAAAAEEAGAWQRRCKGLQGEADEREVELARRDLRAKASSGPAVLRMFPHCSWA